MSFAGVILAGGRGTRMGPLGERYPKALLPVGDRTVIGHHLAFLESLGVERLVIVLGHRGEDIRRALGTRSAGGRPIAYLEQPSPLGSAHAVACARHQVDGPFVLLLGDYFFRAPGAGPLLLDHLERGDSAMLAKREPDLALVRAACTLELDDGGRVRRIVEKPRQPTTDLKGCGVYALQPEVHEAIAATPPTGTRGEHELSVALQLFVDAGHRLFAEEVIEWDRNLTCPGDVLRCNLEWLDRHGVSRWIAEGASVPSGSPVERAVVGPGAEVSPGVRVRNAVVFPEARVTRDSRRGLITPYGRFSCEAEAAPGGRRGGDAHAPREDDRSPPRSLFYCLDRPLY